MSQPTSVDVSIKDRADVSPTQDVSAAREHRLMVPGIAWFTANRAAAVLRNVSPKDRKFYIGMLSYSPATIAYLRQEFRKPLWDIPGEVRMQFLQILDEAEERVDWKALEHMDS